MNGLISIIANSPLKDKLIEYLKTLSKAELAIISEDTPFIFMAINLFFVRHFNIIMYVDKCSYAFTYYDISKDKDKYTQLLKDKTYFIKCVESDKGIEQNIGLCILDVIKFIEIPF